MSEDEPVSGALLLSLCSLAGRCFCARQDGIAPKPIGRSKLLPWELVIWH